MTALLLVLWLLPLVVAFGRELPVRRRVAIAIVTVFLSWTLVGWVAALLWAVESEPKSCDYS
jgi:hypothetical protein